MTGGEHRVWVNPDLLEALATARGSGSGTAGSLNIRLLQLVGPDRGDELPFVGWVMIDLTAEEERCLRTLRPACLMEGP